MQNAAESQGILHFTASEEKKISDGSSKKYIKYYFY